MATNLSEHRPIKRGYTVLNRAEESRALGKLENRLAKAFVSFVVQTGLRISEALVVRVSDIENGHVVIKGKRDRVRTTHFNPLVREQMLRYVHERKLRKGQESNLLFPVCRNTINYHLKKVGLYPHQLRHTFLQRQYDRTKDIKLVQELAGHKSITTTAVYLHYREEQLKEAYDLAISPFQRLFSNIILRLRDETTVAKIPDRSITYDDYHNKFVVYGDKGVGKSYIINNTWKGLTPVKWDTKGQVNREIRLMKNDDVKMLWVDYGNPTPTKMLHAEQTEYPLVAEFRTQKPIDIKNISKRLFEFQPSEIEPFSIREARQYLKHLCKVTAASYSSVKNLVEINTNPLFLRENLFRNKKEIRMSSPPATLGPMFIVVAIMFLLSRYVAMGRESYFVAMGGFFIFRIISRL